MDLCETGIGEGRAPLVGAPDGAAIGPLGIGAQVEGIAVAACRQHHRVAQVRLDLARDQVPRDDAARLAVNHDQVLHLGARE